MLRSLALILAVAPLISARDFEESVRAAMAASLARQKASVQQQASAVTQAPPSGTPAESGSDFFTVAWPQPPQWTALVQPVAECSPIPKPRLDAMISAAAQKEGLKEDLVSAVIGQESGAKPCAVSPKGAQGLMQLMPQTAAELGALDLFDPAQNIAAGTKLLKQLLTKYNGNTMLALGAYNAGASRVDQAGGIPEIPETINYVSNILTRVGVSQAAEMPGPE